MGLFNEVRAVPKPNHKRRVKKQKERGRISRAAYDEVWKRDRGRCALCQKNENEVWTLEVHHIIPRSAGGSGEAHNLALACGPATQTGTCHWKAHNTRAGRQAFEEYLQKIYGDSPWW
ncbi:HNH endonuclease [Brevibacillus fluminis]|uniref:HNH endonuclease n=1 Tax=Brevibacillus fluminis TaxID=511487 RepID=UPI003F8C8ECC